jgi:hypothetical protein
MFKRNNMKNIEINKSVFNEYSLTEMQILLIESCMIKARIDQYNKIMPTNKKPIKTAYEILDYNLKNQNNQYSKAEHKETKPSAFEMRDWNELLPKAEQYTKAEHKEKNPSAEDMRRWNHYLPKAEQYSKAEHKEAYPTANEMILWNGLLPNAEQYTEKERNK